MVDPVSVHRSCPVRPKSVHCAYIERARVLPLPDGASRVITHGKMVGCPSDSRMSVLL